MKFEPTFNIQVFYFHSLWLNINGGLGIVHVARWRLFVKREVEVEWVFCIRVSVIVVKVQRSTVTFSVIVHVLVSLMLVQKESEVSESGLYNSLVSLMPGTQKKKSFRNSLQRWYKNVW